MNLVIMKRRFFYAQQNSKKIKNYFGNNAAWNIYFRQWQRSGSLFCR